MSWGPITASNVPLADIDAELAKAANAYRETLAGVGQEIKPEVAEQIDAAIPASKSLAESGAVGTGRVTVSMSGHANPDHKPVAGWANDFVTITAYCITE